jgi:hypothetical protein
VAACLPSKHENLNSNPSTIGVGKKKKEREKTNIVRIQILYDLTLKKTELKSQNGIVATKFQ